jgi:hypothetical protein
MMLTGCTPPGQRGRVPDLGQVGDLEVVAADRAGADRHGGVDDHSVTVRGILVISNRRAGGDHTRPAEPTAQLLIQRLDHRTDERGLQVCRAGMAPSISMIASLASTCASRDTSAAIWAGEPAGLVEPVAAGRVDPGRAEQPGRVVVAQHAYRHLAMPGEVSDGEHDASYPTASHGVRVKRPLPSDAGSCDPGCT